MVSCDPVNEMNELNADDQNLLRHNNMTLVRKLLKQLLHGGTHRDGKEIDLVHHAT